jgi:hypothetical protein
VGEGDGSQDDQLDGSQDGSPGEKRKKENHPIMSSLRLDKRSTV